MFFNNTKYSVRVGVVVLRGSLSQLPQCSPTRMVPL